jgi:hypothetical protein
MPNFPNRLELRFPLCQIVYLSRITATVEFASFLCLPHSLPPLLGTDTVGILEMEVQQLPQVYKIPTVFGLTPTKGFTLRIHEITWFDSSIQ